MKIERLKEIIREEVKKALKEKNGTEVVDPDTDTKTKPVEPGTDDGEFDIIKEPSEEPAKAKSKKIAEKIGYRYAQILKNKK